MIYSLDLHCDCDKCNDYSVYERETHTDCIRAAGNDGWSINSIIDECYCPKCSGKEVHHEQQNTHSTAVG